MSRFQNIISEHTSISLTVLISLVGGIFWLTTLYAKTESTAQAISRIEINQTEYNKNLMEINQRLSRIEGMLDNK